MKEQIVDTLSNGDFTFKAPILYYESIEEGDVVGGPGSMLREANLNLDYRGARQDLRDLLIEVVQELTGVEPLQKDTGEKDEKGQPIFEVDEKDGKYIVRALAANSSVTNDDVQNELNRRARGYTAADGTVVAPLAVDVKKRERKPPKPRKLAQDYKDTAAKILAGPNLNKFMAMVADYVPGKSFTPIGDTAKDTETLGWIVKEYFDAKNKAEKSQLANALA